MESSDLQLSDVRILLRMFIETIGIGFHPDDDFNDYVCRETGEPSLPPFVANVWNYYLDACFGACEREGVDIYEESMKIARELFPILDELFPAE